MTWIKSLKNKAIQRRDLGDNQTALLLGDYGGMESAAAVAPTSTVVEISPEHKETTESEPEVLFDTQAPPETEASEFPCGKE